MACGGTALQLVCRSSKRELNHSSWCKDTAGLDNEHVSTAVSYSDSDNCELLDRSMILCLVATCNIFVVLHAGAEWPQQP